MLPLKELRKDPSLPLPASLKICHSLVWVSITPIFTWCSPYISLRSLSSVCNLGSNVPLYKDASHID